MRSKIRTAFLMCALVFGVSAASASAQTVRRVYRTPSRTVVVTRSRTRHVAPNWWGRRNVRRARTYRLPNGRLVTVLPNGRRIIH